jgi:GTPase SAR1 family protein
MERTFNEKFFNYHKILIFGDDAVGKTSFVNRINKKDFEMMYTPSDCTIKK